MSVGQFFNALFHVLPVALIGFLLIFTVGRKIEDRIQTVFWYGVARFLVFLVNVVWWGLCGIVVYHLSP